MVSKLALFLNQNRYFLFITVTIVLLLNVLLLYFLSKLSTSIEFVGGCCYGNGSIILAGTWIIVKRYFEWQYQTARFELLDGNVQSTMSAYRIKKPLKKEVSIGVFFPGSIDKGTTRLSNIMNIMEFVSIVILCLILIISYNIDNHMNITSIVIGVFVTFLLFLFHIILDSYNYFCTEICKLINPDMDVLITDSLDDVVSRNRSRITMTLVATVLVLLLNLLSVFFM